MFCHISTSNHMIMRVIFPKSAEDHCDSLLITYFRTIIDNIVDKDTGTAPRGGKGALPPKSDFSPQNDPPQKIKASYDLIGCLIL